MTRPECPYRYPGSTQTWLHDPIVSRVAHSRQLEGDPRYTLLEPIGKDSIGGLWQAEDIFTGQPVTIKVLHASFSRHRPFQERLSSKIEALTRPVLIDGRLAHRLSHPSVVRVLRATITNGDSPPYVVMEPLQGRLLADVLAEAGQRDAGEVARIGVQLAGALHAAHQAGIIHGCLHPGNVLLTAGGRSRIMDFGVMLAVLSSRSTTDKMKPLAPFLAPEHDPKVTPRPASDVYSLAALLLTMLTGRPPVEKIEGREPSDALARACFQALATDPKGRPSAIALESTLSSAAASLPHGTDRLLVGLERSSGQRDVRGAALEANDPIVALESPDGAVIDVSGPGSSDQRAPEASVHQLARTPRATLPSELRSPAPAEPPAPPSRRAPTILTPAAPSPPSPTPESGSEEEPRQEGQPVLPSRFGRFRPLSGALARGLAKGTASTKTALAAMSHSVIAGRISKARSAVAERGQRLLRPPAVWYVSAAVVLLIAVALLTPMLLGGETARQGGLAPASPAGPVGQTPLTPTSLFPSPIAMPSVVGMTAFAARERLAQIGLVIAHIEPTLGIPGIVDRTDPEEGAQVAPGEEVTLFVGTSRSRVGRGG
jgi:serine/threonine protein kinase